MCMYVCMSLFVCVCMECYKQTLSSAFKVWHKQWQLLQLPHPAVHNCTPRDVKLRHTLEAAVALPPLPSLLLALSAPALGAGQFFPLLPIIFTKKLHTKCATLQRPPSATSAGRDDAAADSTPLPQPPAYAPPHLLFCHSLAHFLCLNSHSQVATVEHRLRTFWAAQRLLLLPTCAPPSCLLCLVPAGFRSALCDPQVPSWAWLRILCLCLGATV